MAEEKRKFNSQTVAAAFKKHVMAQGRYNKNDKPRVARGKVRRPETKVPPRSPEQTTIGEA